MSFIDQDEEDYEYGNWVSHDIYSALKELKQSYYNYECDPFEIWPNWADGVPTKLRRMVRIPGFVNAGIWHRDSYGYVSREYDWNVPRKIKDIKSNYSLLPRTSSGQWSGVYRIFAPDCAVDRCCGKDPTGTLYIGLAGVGKRNWSNLRSRIMALATGDHHAISKWHSAEAFRRMFPRDLLRVEWTFTQNTSGPNGKMIPEAPLAETLLLSCYRSAFGEYPPWNEKG